jgi:hypothetical protein
MPRQYERGRADLRALDGRFDDGAWRCVPRASGRQDRSPWLLKRTAGTRLAARFIELAGKMAFIRKAGSTGEAAMDDPLAAALLGAKVGGGDAARLRIERLAAAFDPCVAFAVNLSERPHA